MKKSRMILLCFLCAVLLSACGETEITTTTVEILSSGKVTHTIIDSFEESYYDAEEMKEMAQKEADEFNNSHKDGAVTVESVQLENGQVRMVMDYADARAYSDFNSETLFYGTVSDALAAGYDLNVNLISLKDNTQYLSGEELSSMGDKHLIITSESLHIIAPSNLSYVSEGVIIASSRKEADTVPEDAFCYILLK